MAKPKPVPNDSGRFGMVSPRDLLDKLEHDFQRLQQAKDQTEITYAVFDCAVAAWSINDWCIEYFKFDADYAKTKFTADLLVRIPELKICQLVATGAKHFRIRKMEAGDLYTSVSAIHTARLSPDGSGIVERKTEYFAFVHYEGKSYACDDLFAELIVKIRLFLEDEKISERSAALHCQWDFDLG